MASWTDSSRNQARDGKPKDAEALDFEALVNVKRAEVLKRDALDLGQLVLPFGKPDSVQEE